MNLINLLIYFSALSLSITYIITSFSFVIRVVGAINNINAKSWNLASAITMLNSFFVALALSSIAFILDTNPKLTSIVFLFFLSTTFVIFGHVFMIFYFHQTHTLIKWISFQYFKDKLINDMHILKLNFFKFDLITSFAWICFLIGFIFPSMLAVIFNEYRTTLFQLSFVFNSIGTFLTIVITDKKASLLSDKNNLINDDKIKILNYLSSVLFNRLISSLFIFFLIIIFFLIGFI